MNYNAFEDVEAVKKTYGLEIKRLKSLCWFYMALAGGMAIMAGIFAYGWLDMVSFIISLNP